MFTNREQIQNEITRDFDMHFVENAPYFNKVYQFWVADNGVGYRVENFYEKLLMREIKFKKSSSLVRVDA